MELPTHKRLLFLRSRGFRPQAVGCLIQNYRVLMVYKNEHNLWQLPQGGIEFRETAERGLRREMMEELGKYFARGIGAVTLIGENEVAFPPGKQGRGMLKMSRRGKRPVIGKHYFFFAAEVRALICVEDTEFDDIRFVSFSEALRLAATIYQKGKKRITEHALTRLNERGLLL